MVTSVPNGGALEIAPGVTVRVEVFDLDGPTASFVDPASLEATVSAGDATLILPDGQSIVLLAYGETLLERALGEGLDEGHSVASASQEVQSVAAQAFAAQVSIDYLGDGLDVSRVNLLFDKQEGLDVEALFVALETELGLRSPGDNPGPSITGMTVVEQPLDLSDLLLESTGAATVDQAAPDTVIGGTPNYHDMASLLAPDEEALAVNDNDFMINA